MSDKLDKAYALDGPDAVKRLYADWAESYDTDFAAARGYALPDAVAEALLSVTLPDGPILDIGAGTGLLAEALRKRGFARPIDGVDLSAQMLRIARGKALYRDLIEADVTQPLTGSGPWAGFVSAGTFTHGHVGPEALSALAERALPGAVMVLSINEGVYEARGFAALLGQWERVGALDLTRVAIYAAGAAPDPDHGADTALIARFRLT